MFNMLREDIQEIQATQNRPHRKKPFAANVITEDTIGNFRPPIMTLYHQPSLSYSPISNKHEDGRANTLDNVQSILPHTHPNRIQMVPKAKTRINFNLLRTFNKNSYVFRRVTRLKERKVVYPKNQARTSRDPSPLPKQIH